VLFPLQCPELFEEKSRQPFGCLLLYGPPGTGKTQVARGLVGSALELMQLRAGLPRLTFFNVDSADMKDKFSGHAEKFVKQLFLIARQVGPSVIFFDEVDSFLGTGDPHNMGVRKQFQTMTQGLTSADFKSRVFVLGATNYPEHLDGAVLRRFQLCIPVDLPDRESLERIFDDHCPEHTGRLRDVAQIAYDRKLSGADAVNACRKAYAEDGIRKLAKSKHWRRDGDSWLPCCASEQYSVSLTLSEVAARSKSGSLKNPPLTLKTLQQVVSSFQRSVLPDDLTRLDKWKKERGS
jgi:vacuolar protein-sorting-associated protein 4